jgi:hypothetical protein
VAAAAGVASRPPAASAPASALPAEPERDEEGGSRGLLGGEAVLPPESLPPPLPGAEVPLLLPGVPGAAAAEAAAEAAPPGTGDRAAVAVSVGLG